MKTCSLTATALSVATTLAESAYSFAGMLLLLGTTTIGAPAQIIIAMSSALFTGGIEYKVINKNITKALSRETAEYPAMAFAACCAIGLFFSTLSVAKTTLLLIGISAAYSPLLAAVIAGIGAIGYSIMIYNSITEYINKEPGTSGKNSSLTSNLMINMLCASIAFFMILATAGTVFNTARRTVTILGTRTLKYVADFFIMVAAVGQCIFSLVNIQKTAVELSEMTSISLATLYKKIKAAFPSLESKLPTSIVGKIFYLPTVLLSLVIDLIYNISFAIAFIAHCVAEGVTTDNAFLVSPLIAAITSSLAEALIDLSYYSNNEKNHDHAHLPVETIFAVLLSPLHLIEGLLKSTQNKNGVLKNIKSAFCDRQTHHHSHHHSHPTHSLA